MPITRRTLTAAALLLLPASLTACSTTPPPSATTPRPAAATPSPSTGPAGSVAKLGVPFRNGSFEVTATKVDTGVRQLDIDDTAKSGGLKPWVPKNGQYIVVHLTARNVGNEPATCSVTSSRLVDLVDAAGKTYDTAGPLLGAIPVGQNLDVTMQPDTTASGLVVFDVPPTATGPTTLILQTDPYVATTNPPTAVGLR